MGIITFYDKFFTGRYSSDLYLYNIQDIIFITTWLLNCSIKIKYHQSEVKENAKMGRLSFHHLNNVFLHGDSKL